MVSDVFGKTGKSIIEALITGVTDPAQLAELARGSLVRKKDQLKKALNGKITDHHRFMLQLIVNTITHINQQIALLEAQMGISIEAMKQDAQLLQTIPGVLGQIATGILAEIGNDMSVSPSHAHLSSWAGVCPGNNESAGKKKSSRGYSWKQVS